MDEPFKPSLDILPHDVRAYIASFLDRKNLLFFASTSKNQLRSAIVELKKHQQAILDSIHIRANHNQSALYTSDVLYMWGNNKAGQLGMGETSNLFNPTAISNIRGKILNVVLSYEHTFVLTDQGLFSSGDNRCGQLGLVRTTARYTFREVKKVPGKILAITSGSSHTLIVTEQGLYGCGSNLVGQLGLPKQQYYLQLTKIENIPGKIIKIASGLGHNLILTDRGLYGLGRNDCGQLGVENNNNYANFVKIDGLPGSILAIAAGGCHSLVLTDQGLFSCGLNNLGQLTQGHTNNCNTFMPVKNLIGKVLQISAGFSTTLIITDQGLFACGGNLYGQLGLGYITQAETELCNEMENHFKHLGLSFPKPKKSDKHNDTLMPISSIIGVPLKIAAGENHSLLLTAQGLYSCGTSGDGELGLGHKIENADAKRVNKKGFNLTALNPEERVIEFPECHLYTQIKLPPQIDRLLSRYRYVSNLIELIEPRSSTKPAPSEPSSLAPSVMQSYCQML